MPKRNQRSVAIIFDMDGILCDTVELHYLGWKQVADDLGIPFDREANNELRGLMRPQSLEHLLIQYSGELSVERKQAVLADKNRDFLQRLKNMSSDDLLPGVRVLLDAIRERGVPAGVASSSRNTRAVISQLGIASFFSALVDANDVEQSKPDPRVFVQAAETLGVEAEQCVAIEDSSSGVEAALRAGMRVVGVGPAGRVGKAHHVRDSLVGLDLDTLLGV